MKFGLGKIECAATIAMICVTASAMADIGSSFEQRGYQTCITDLKRDFGPSAGLSHAPRYYVAKHGDDVSYFVNSYAWRDSDRVSLRTRCETAGWGRILVSRDTQAGRWSRANEGHVSIYEVSSN